MPLAVLALVLAAAAAPASAAAPALKLNTTSIASGDWVRLDWSGVAKADRDGCWIGGSAGGASDEKGRKGERKEGRGSLSHDGGRARRGKHAFVCMCVCV